MDLSKLSSIKLYLIRNSENAKEVDTELDRRNGKVSKKKTNRKPKYRMVDYDYENNQWDLGKDWGKK